MAWTLTSWLACVLGLTGTWLVLRHPNGWLINIASCAAWVVYNSAIHCWAGVTACVIAALISARNWAHTR
jgi:hypothetical protein